MNLFKTYFFIPANNKKFIEKGFQTNAIDCKVYDFEDSVVKADLAKSIENVSKVEIGKTDWARIPLVDDYWDLASKLKSIGFQNFILPKVNSADHLIEVVEKSNFLNPSTRLILLIESAYAYTQLQNILDQCSQFIYGIGLGSHDFSSDTLIKHSEEILFPLRLKISLLAKAYNLIPIDIASMNISDFSGMQHEIQSGFDLGYRAKFFIHPFQLEALSEYSFYTIEEVLEAKEILDKLGESSEKSAVVKFKGKIYEKPHLNSLNEILEWGKQYYESDW